MSNARPSRPAALLLALVLLGCSTGNSPPLHPDTRKRVDQGQAQDVVEDAAVPDLRKPDKAITPDKGPKVDQPPKPDSGLCGNKVVDPGELCDKGIVAGKEGACPTATDCDDQNKCTTDSLAGSAAACTAECKHVPIAACCGNGTIDSGEECDDGNVVDKDGCSNTCALPGGHLVITEVATSPSEAEFIELYNPGKTAVPLAQVYVSDRADYYQIPKGSLTSSSTDFVARFPTGATIAPGAYVTVSISGALGYKTTFGKAPDYEMINTDGTVPDMVAAVTGPPSSIGSQAGLTDGGELVVLFSWDGAADLVKDLDYVVWKGSSATAVSKNASICIDGPDADTSTTCYLDDTAVTNQMYLGVPGQGGSLHRCNHVEDNEKKTGGNGATGHDETSEPWAGVGATWKINATTLKNRTPGAPAPAGFCPI